LCFHIGVFSKLSSGLLLKIARGKKSSFVPVELADVKLIVLGGRNRIDRYSWNFVITYDSMYSSTRYSRSSMSSLTRYLTIFFPPGGTRQATYSNRSIHCISQLNADMTSSFQCITAVPVVGSNTDQEVKNKTLASAYSPNKLHSHPSNHNQVPHL
jgi:hypothetical protein